MNELKCPKCGNVFTVDEADYASILNQVKNAEFQNEVNRRIAEISSHISNLDKGVKNYDQRLLTLKRILEQKLSQKYSRNVQVDILADLLEVKTPSWKNAIEGYLNTQKFYLFLDPIYFEDALKIYDEVKPDLIVLTGDNILGNHINDAPIGNRQNIYEAYRAEYS